MMHLQTTKEIAKKCNTSDQTVKDWLTQGLHTITVGKSGKHRRTTMEWVEEFLSKKKEPNNFQNQTKNNSMKPILKKIKEKFDAKYKNRK